MRARLQSMISGQEFSFLCVPKMAEEMMPIIFSNKGEIVKKDIRSYGIVMSVRKTA